jgi:haloalkane dehalogenase
MLKRSLEEFVAAKKHANVLDSQMAYYEVGEGAPIVFLHGNPTSSIMWRNVLPNVAHLGRCIAPDLIGMGDSGKLDPKAGAAYRFVEHRRYLDGLLEQLDVTDAVTLIVHDWGSALGFDWANRHRNRVRGIAYTEAIVAPIASWDDMPANARGIFQGMRSEKGESLVIERNSFVERILPGAILRKFTQEEHDAYRQPFLNPEDRWPTLQWPRELPIEGTPEDVTAIVADYSAWLATAEIPTLFINADPGSILTGRARDFCRTWPNQSEITVPGIHFVSEDSPDEIGRALAAWIPGLA